jgi:hypothetical protein
MTVLPTYHKKKNPPAKKTIHSTSQHSPNITSSILDGISFGAGSSIGHNIINKISSHFSDNEKTESKCEDFLKKIEDCKNNYGNFKQELSNDVCLDLLKEYENCKNK